MELDNNGDAWEDDNGTVASTFDDASLYWRDTSGLFRSEVEGARSIPGRRVSRYVDMDLGAERDRRAYLRAQVSFSYEYIPGQDDERTEMESFKLFITGITDPVAADTANASDARE